MVGAEDVPATQLGALYHKFCDGDPEGFLCGQLGPRSRYSEFTVSEQDIHNIAFSDDGRCEYRSERLGLALDLCAELIY